MMDRIEHRKPHEQAAERPELDVHRAEPRPGGPLDHGSSLGERFGAGRTVIREAMKSLSENGPVEIRRGQDNVVVVDARQELHGQILQVPGAPAHGLRHHRPILSAVAAGDAAAARGAVREHLKAGRGGRPYRRHHGGRSGAEREGGMRSRHPAPLRGRRTT